MLESTPPQKVAWKPFAAQTRIERKKKGHMGDYSLELALPKSKYSRRRTAEPRLSGEAEGNEFYGAEEN